MLREEWKQVLFPEMRKRYFRKLQRDLAALRETKPGLIYPPEDQVFEAFNLCPPARVKCVIVGQDPYHTPGCANGLAFSVPADKGIPPSLRNIYKELQNDLSLPPPNHGDLSKWAREGVLLLNSVLTVEDGLPGSHRERGWEHFTNAVVSYLDRQKRPLVFILWGVDAQKKEPFITHDQHLVIKSAHPSPFSANGGFFGSKPFSLANKHLIKAGIDPIDWSIPDKR